MKGKRGFRAVSAALAAFLWCGGCGQTSPPAEETTKIFLSETELFLEEGESFPADGHVRARACAGDSGGMAGLGRLGGVGGRRGGHREGRRRDDRHRVYGRKHGRLQSHGVGPRGQVSGIGRIFPLSRLRGREGGFLCKVYNHDSEVCGICPL